MKEDTEENISDIDDPVSCQINKSNLRKPTPVDNFAPHHINDDVSISSHSHSIRSGPLIPHYARSLSPTDSLMSPTSMRVNQLHHKILSRSALDNVMDSEHHVRDFSLESNLTRCEFPLVGGIPLVLGSSSSSRQEVLTLLKWPYTVMIPDIDEKAIRSTNYTELPQLIAKAKADAIVKRLKEDKVEGPLVLVTCDQVTLYKDIIREKPESVEEAKHYLSTYSNDSVSTCSAIVVTEYPSERQACDIDLATVYWKAISPEVIDAVVSRGKIFSSCGGFRIEDPDLSKLIDHIDGAVDSVVGLPVETLVRLIGKVVDDDLFKFSLVGNIVTLKSSTSDPSDVHELNEVWNSWHFHNDANVFANRRMHALKSWTRSEAHDSSQLHSPTQSRLINTSSTVPSTAGASVSDRWGCKTDNGYMSEASWTSNTLQSSPTDRVMSPVSMKIARKKASTYKSISRNHTKRKDYNLQTDVTRRHCPVHEPTRLVLGSDSPVKRQILDILNWTYQVIIPSDPSSEELSKVEVSGASTCDKIRSVRSSCSSLNTSISSKNVYGSHLNSVHMSSIVNDNKELIDYVEMMAKASADSIISQLKLASNASTVTTPAAAVPVTTMNRLGSLKADNPIPTNDSLKPDISTTEGTSCTETELTNSNFESAEDIIIISTHQIAVFHGEKRLEPHDEEEARLFLSSYSNQAVATITAVVATHYPSERQAYDTDIASVYFREINDDVIEQVIKRRDVLSCVGGFRIDDPDLNPLIQHIEGSVDSLFGMPVDVLVRVVHNVCDPARASHPDHHVEYTSSSKSNLLQHLEKGQSKLMQMKSISLTTGSLSVTSSGASSPVHPFHPRIDPFHPRADRPTMSSSSGQSSPARLISNMHPLHPRPDRAGAGVASSSSGQSSPVRNSHYKTSPFSRVTKWLKVACPGKKIAVRSAANVKADVVRYVSSGDVLHVQERTIRGFYHLTDHSGYVNAEANGVEWKELMFPPEEFINL